MSWAIDGQSEYHSIRFRETEIFHSIPCRPMQMFIPPNGSLYCVRGSARSLHEPGQELCSVAIRQTLQWVFSIAHSSAKDPPSDESEVPLRHKVKENRPAWRYLLDFRRSRQ